MAKKRYVNTRFWDDTYISELAPIEKLLFLYFLTNQRTEVCGIYEIPLKSIIVDTGIDSESLSNALEHFSNDQKILYVDGWVYVKNFVKHQSMNENMKLGVDRGLKEVPNEIMSKIRQVEEGFESLSNHSEASTLPKPKLIPKPKPKPILKPKLTAASDESAEIENPVNNIIGMFEKVNPSFRRLFANKTQRDSVARLIGLHGFEGVSGIVGILDQLICQPFCPKVTTPYDLERDWGKLKAFVAQQGKINNKNSIGII